MASGDVVFSVMRKAGVREGGISSKTKEATLLAGSGGGV